MDAPLDSCLSHLLVGMMNPSEFGSCKDYTPSNIWREATRGDPLGVFLQVQRLCTLETQIDFFGPGLNLEGMDLDLDLVRTVAQPLMGWAP